MTNPLDKGIKRTATNKKRKRIMAVLKKKSITGMMARKDEQMRSWSGISVFHKYGTMPTNIT